MVVIEHLDRDFVHANFIEQVSQEDRAGILHQSFAATIPVKVKNNIDALD